MLALSLALFVGILALQSFSFLPPSHLLGDALPFLLLYGLLQSKSRLVLMLLFGFFWANWQAEHVLRLDLPATYWQQPLIITGKISAISRQNQDKTQFKLDVSHIEQQPDLHIGTVVLTWYHRANTKTTAPTLAIGEIWQMQVKLKPISSYRNQHSKDKSRYLLSQGIRHQGYVVLKSHTPQRLERASLSILAQLRQTILESINVSIGNHPQRGLLQALSIGERKQMYPQDWEILKHTGTSHLMAISGLHIGYIALLSGLLVGGLYRYFAPVICLHYLSVPTVALIAAVIGASAYAALSGFAIPAQRALLMLAIPVLAKVFYRHIPLEKALAPTFILILLWDSFVVLSASFYLSFLAVALIFLGISTYPYQQTFNHQALNDISIKCPAWRKAVRNYLLLSPLSPLSIFRYIKALFWVSLLIMVGMLPLSLFWFSGMGIVSPFANIIAIPWVGFVIMPLIIAALLCLPFFPNISGFLWACSADGLGLLLSYLYRLKDLNLYWDYGQISMLQLAAALSLAILFLLPRGLLPRWLIGLSILLLLYRPHNPLNPAEVSVSVFDVGQGLAVLLRTQNHNLLYDTGIKTATQQVVLPHLYANQIKTLDRLIISHRDYDHSGGIALLTKNLEIKQLLSSEPEFFQLADIDKQHCQNGQSWQWDGVKFQMLHPEDSYELRSHNDNSCVLKVSAGEQSLLISGDISQKAEGFLLQMHSDELDSDILIVPHHGSRYSSRRRFIRATSPKIAIVSTGFLNRYHHPVPEVVNAYQNAGANVLDTAKTGEIQLLLGANKNENFNLQTQARHYWQAHYLSKQR